MNYRMLKTYPKLKARRRQKWWGGDWKGAVFKVGKTGRICAPLCGISLTSLLGGFQCYRNSQSACEGGISITQEHARHADSWDLPRTTSSEFLEVGFQGNLDTCKSSDTLPSDCLLFVFAKR